MTSYNDNFLNDIRNVGSFFNIMQGIMSFVGGIAMMYMAYSSYVKKDVEIKVIEARVKEVMCVSRLLRSRRSLSSGVTCTLLVDFENDGEIVTKTIQTRGYDTYVKNQPIRIQTGDNPGSYEICCTNHSQNLMLYALIGIVCLVYAYYNFYYYNSLTLGIYNMTSTIFN